MKLSVILPAYNAEKYLLRSVKSILTQTFRDFELLVINDGSSDQTRAIIEQVSDPRLRAIHLPENTGLINVLNLGLELAKGEYIARMDADDISLPTRFEEQVNFLQSNPDHVACGTSIINFNDDSHSYMRYPQTDAEIKVALHFFERNICHPTVMLRKSAIDEHSIRYRPEYPHAEDYRLWVELAKVGKLYNLPQGLLKYYRHQDQISAKYYPEQIAISKQVVREVIRDTWPFLSDDRIDSVIQLCVHQHGMYPTNHFPIKELNQTIDEILNINKTSQEFEEFHLKRLLYFKKFRCSFYYLYRPNYLTKLRCFMNFFLIEPKRAIEDLNMQTRSFYIKRIKIW